jgi:hypothetical protein
MSTSYGTLVASKTYHAARGNAAWADAADADLEVALLRGSEYVDFTFRSSFPGNKTGLRTQEREWPREWAFDKEGNAIPTDEVPVEVEHAAYEAALRELASPGSLMPDLTLGKQIKAARVEGAVSVEYTGPTGAQGMRPVVSIVAGILDPILTGNGGASMAGRTMRT